MIRHEMTRGKIVFPFHVCFVGVVASFPQNKKRKQQNKKKPFFEMKRRVFIGAFLNFTNRTTFNIEGSVVIRTRLCIDLRDKFY